MSKVRFSPCPFCCGSGQFPLTGVYAETLEMLRKYGETTGASLSAFAGCKPTTMNNRLAALERRGFAKSYRYGSKRIFKAK